MPHIAPGNDTTPGTRPAAASIGRRTLGKTVSGTDLGRPDGRGSGQFAEAALDTLYVARNRG
jgi:hypothetical protein